MASLGGCAGKLTLSMIEAEHNRKMIDWASPPGETTSSATRTEGDNANISYPRTLYRIGGSSTLFSSIVVITGGELQGRWGAVSPGAPTNIHHNNRARHVYQRDMGRVMPRRRNFKIPNRSRAPNAQAPSIQISYVLAQGAVLCEFIRDLRTGNAHFVAFARSVDTRCVPSHSR